MLADDVVEEGISDSIHICALQWDQHYHLTKVVHNRHDGVVAAVFRQVCDEVNVDLLPQALWNWQQFVQASQIVCIGLVALTNVTALTVLTYIIPHAWPAVLLSNHCVSSVYTNMATCIMKLM